MSNTERPLTQQEREARAKYFREWRAKNRDKVQVYNRRYWQNRAAREKEADNATENI